MVMAIIISVILLFLGIGVLVMIHICIVGGAFGRRFGNDNNNNNNVVERGSLASTSMSREEVEKLPSFDFRERQMGSNKSPIDDCAVCLEKFKSGDKCRLLPLCKHSFHAQCVDLWLLKTPICPMCRTNTEFWRVGSMSGEDSSLFSESGHFNIEVAMELGDISQTRESDHFDEIVVVEDEDCGEINVEVANKETGDSVHLGEFDTCEKEIVENV